MVIAFGIKPEGTTKSKLHWVEAKEMKKVSSFPLNLKYMWDTKKEKRAMVMLVFYAIYSVELNVQ